MHEHPYAREQREKALFDACFADIPKEIKDPAARTSWAIMECARRTEEHDAGAKVLTPSEKVIALAEVKKTAEAAVYETLKAQTKTLIDQFIDGVETLRTENQMTCDGLETVRREARNYSGYTETLIRSEIAAVKRDFSVIVEGLRAEIRELKK